MSENSFNELLNVVKSSITHPYFRLVTRKWKFIGTFGSQIDCAIG